MAWKGRWKVTWGKFPPVSKGRIDKPNAEWTKPSELPTQASSCALTEGPKRPTASSREHGPYQTQDSPCIRVTFATPMTRESHRQPCIKIPVNVGGTQVRVCRSALHVPRFQRHIADVLCRVQHSLHGQLRRRPYPRGLRISADIPAAVAEKHRA